MVDSPRFFRWTGSSVGQSGGLIIPWSWVQVPPGPPVARKDWIMKLVGSVVLAAAVSALACGCATVGERTLSVEDYRDKMAGAWIGQSVGVAYGAPTEFKCTAELVPESMLPEWKPEMVNGTFSQDDLYVEMTFLDTLDRRGIDVTAREAGIDFANSRYRLWCANWNGRNNLRSGLAPTACSHPKHHATTDDIDYQIEADYSGIVSPGCPARVILLGDKFGRLMNYGDGLYAGIFMGAMYAEAYFENDRVKTVEAGLASIPAESRYAEMVRDMLRWYRENPSDWQSAWRKAREKYGRKDSPMIGQVSWFGIDCKINGAMVLLGYLWGEGDVFKTMYISTRGGYDSDCNPSSALGVLGVQIGAKGFEPKYVSALDRTKTWEFTDYNYPKLLEKCEKLTRLMVVADGGRVEVRDGRERFVIPAGNRPVAAFEDSRTPGPCGDEKLTDAENARIRYRPCKDQGSQSEERGSSNRNDTLMLPL